MKNALMIFTLFCGVATIAQKGNLNSKKGYLIHGYDVVAYFDGAAKEGSKDYELDYQGVKLKFSSSANRDRFSSNPDKYLPKYGGYCAYAMALSGKKVPVNPETFEIRDGELFLFYNSGKNNTLESWLAESPETLRAKADANWADINK